MKHFIALFSLGLMSCYGGPYIIECGGGRPCGDGGTMDATGSDSGDGDGGVGDGEVIATLQSIEIEPADPTLVVSGMSATQTFTVFGRFSDGTRGALSVGTWSSTTTPAGTIVPGTGRFLANGLSGGTSRISVSVDREGGAALTASTNLTVRYARELFVGGAPMNTRDRFASPITDAGRRVTLRYPLDQAVMPQNVAAPDIQWEGGSSGDAYRVRVVRGNASVTAYVVHSGAGFRFDWVVESTAWRAIAETSTDATIQITVDRATGDTAISGEPITLRLANGSLAGVVYYWDLRDGKILRVFDDGRGREDFMPHPPLDTRTPVGDVDHPRCVACHTISRDGRYMAAEMWEGQGPSTIYDLTTDLTTNPAVPRYPVSTAPQSSLGGTPARSWVYASFNPTNTRLIVNRLGGLRLLDISSPSAISVISTSGTFPSAGAVQPSWSPDGNTIAFVNDFMGPGPTAFSASSLAILPVTGSDTFGAPTNIVAGTTLSSRREAGAAIAYPSWTPDSRWIGFQHGPYSESDGAGSGMRETRYDAAMYLTNPAGSITTRLTRASDDETHSDAFFPNFSPFNQGGYYWVVFFSRRSYGNAQAGTRGTMPPRRQLWVSAISTTINADTDPSNVPYWLPGQDVASDNMSGFWAPQACRRTTESCSVSSECCSGVCSSNGMGGLVCNPPPPETPCRRNGERCGSHSECCAGLACDPNVCLTPPP